MIDVHNLLSSAVDFIQLSDTSEAFTIYIHERLDLDEEELYSAINRFKHSAEFNRTPLEGEVTLANRLCELTIRFIAIQRNINQLSVSQPSFFPYQVFDKVAGQQDELFEVIDSLTASDHITLLNTKETDRIKRRYQSVTRFFSTVHPSTKRPIDFEDEWHVITSNVIACDNEGEMHLLNYNYYEQQWANADKSKEVPTEFTWMYKPVEFKT